MADRVFDRLWLIGDVVDLIPSLAALQEGSLRVG